MFPALCNSWALKREIRWGSRTTEEIAADAFSELACDGGLTREAIWRGAYRLAAQARRDAEAGPLLYGVPEDMHPSAERALNRESLRRHEQMESAFAEDFDQAIRTLDPDLRDAFIVGELRGLPSREAGAVLGVSHATAATRRELATTSIKETISA